MVEVPLANGRGVALIDDEDADFVLARRWYRSNGYAACSPEHHVTMPMHRMLFGLLKGDPLEVDHINGDRLDNRRENLRVCTRAENRQNTPAIGGSSKHRGVGWHKQKSKWRAFAQLNGRYVHLGMFDDEEVAAEAARAYRREHMPFAVER